VGRGGNDAGETGDDDAAREAERDRQELRIVFFTIAVIAGFALLGVLLLGIAIALDWH